jgi:hypothetical protein
MSSSNGATPSTREAGHWLPCVWPQRALAEAPMSRDFRAWGIRERLSARSSHRKLGSPANGTLSTSDARSDLWRSVTFDNAARCLGPVGCLRRNGWTGLCAWAPEVPCAAASYLACITRSCRDAEADS